MIMIRFLVILVLMLMLMVSRIWLVVVFVLFCLIFGW